jgi:hypothetical protein
MFGMVGENKMESKSHRNRLLHAAHE